LKNKTSEAVLKGFKEIYKRGLLKLPFRLEVDAGSEFKSVVKEYFKEKGVMVRIAQVGRHRQQAIVERKNQAIAVPLFKRMTAEEFLTGQKSTAWVDDIPYIVKALNNRAAKNPPRKLPDKPVCSGDACNLLEIGTKVRVQLDNPKEFVNDKKLFSMENSEVLILDGILLSEL